MEPSGKLERTLADHEQRISKLEVLINPTKTPSKKAKKKTVTDHIISLRDSGFFAQPRTADEVHKKLSSTYHCEQNRVAVALFRLANRKVLRKATKSTNQKKYQAYVW